MPDRRNFEHGMAAGEEAHAAAMGLFVGENFEHGGIEQRSVDQHEKAAGLFGLWHAVSVRVRVRVRVRVKVRVRVRVRVRVGCRARVRVRVRARIRVRVRVR